MFGGEDGVVGAVVRVVVRWVVVAVALVVSAGLLG